MPAKNPRLTITLEPSVSAYLRRLSELTGNSQSKLIAELLEGSAPTFQRMIHVLEAANDIRSEARGSIAANLLQAQERIEEQLGLSLESFDDATRPILAEAERVHRRAKKAVAAAAAGTPATTSRSLAAGVATPLSNRGVRSTTKQGKKPTKSRG